MSSHGTSRLALSPWLCCWLLLVAGCSLPVAGSSLLFDCLLLLFGFDCRWSVAGYCLLVTSHLGVVRCWASLVVLWSRVAGSRLPFVFVLFVVVVVIFSVFWIFYWLYVHLAYS